MSELEADAFAMPAGWKAAAFDHGDVVRDFGMRRLVGDGVDAGPQLHLAPPVFGA